MSEVFGFLSPGGNFDAAGAIILLDICIVVTVFTRAAFTADGMAVLSCVVVITGLGDGFGCVCTGSK